MMAGTAYESRVRLPSGSAVLVRIEVAEDDGYDDQGELAEVAQMIATTAVAQVRRGIDWGTGRVPRDPRLVDPWGDHIQPDPFLTSDPATQTRSAAPRYCGECGASEEAHAPGGSRFGSCTFRLRNDGDPTPPC